MNIHIVIKKYNLSEFADTTYWGQFNLLTGLPLSDDQFLKLIDFYSTIDSYRNFIMNSLSFADGQGYKFVSTANSSVVYSYFAVLDLEAIPNIVKNGAEYEEFSTARDLLFAELGWTSFQERVTTVEVTFDKTTNQFVGIPSSYEEIAQLYEISTELETTLGT